METKRRVSGGGGWRTTSLGAWTNYQQTSETDESGVVTTYTHTDSDEIPDVETRAAIPAANGLPAVPARTTTRTWDAARVWQTETITQGATPFAKRVWKRDAEGRILEETRNDALTTRYEYETVPAVDANPPAVPVGSAESYQVRKFERAAGAAQSAERLVSETTTDPLGRLVSITGPGVVEERRTYTVLPNGQTREAVTRGSATATAEQILSERIVDALGRTVREKVNVPLGTERSWEYDAFGRVTREEMGGVLEREYVYSGAGITEKTHPSPDPMRTTVRWPRIETGAGGSYEVERVQTGNRFEERWTCRAKGSVRAYVQN